VLPTPSLLWQERNVESIRTGIGGERNSAEVSIAVVKKYFLFHWIK
jgi:hypothetical protein